MVGMEKFEAGTPTVRVQNGSGAPTGWRPRSESSEPGRDYMKWGTIGPLMVLEAQSWFAKSTACHSQRSPASGRTGSVSGSWAVTRPHLCLWRGAVWAHAFSSRCHRAPSPSAPCQPSPKRSWPPTVAGLKGVSSAVRTQRK